MLSIETNKGKVREIVERFCAAANAKNAVKQAAYMRNQFDFVGLDTPSRRALSKPFLQDRKQDQTIDWQLVKKLWDLPEREFQYLACDYLIKMKKRLRIVDLMKIKTLALQKTWWDTIDNLDELIGAIVRSDDGAKKIVRAWSLNENFWVRRLAIDCQLGFKDDTDLMLLTEVIENNLLGSDFADEFFIKKAIGWALRDLSKANPGWVRSFLSAHESQLTRLSLKEASKYL